jgi:hypothetical protein
VSILASLKDPERWSPLGIDFFSDSVLNQLINVRLHPDKLKFNHAKFVVSETQGKAFINFKAEKNIETRQILFFDDAAGYQYAFLIEKPELVGHSQEGQVLMAFRSNYARSSKRVNTRDSGILIENIYLPSVKIDVEKKKSMVSILMSSYQRMLEEAIPDVEVQTYNTNDDAIINRIQQKNIGFILSNTEDISTYLTTSPLERFLKVSELDAFANFSHLEPEEEQEARLKKRIQSEFIIPILFRSETSEVINNLGYIRKVYQKGVLPELEEKHIQALDNTIEAILTSVGQGNYEPVPCILTVTDASDQGISVEVNREDIANLIREKKQIRCGLRLPDMNKKLIIELELQNEEQRGDSLRFGLKILQISFRSIVSGTMQEAQHGYRLALQKLSSN